MNMRYQARRGAFYAQHPWYPWVDRERSRLAEEAEGSCWEGLDELRSLELFMVAYRDKYPGEVVAHLWDCGCEKVREGDESEESEDGV